MDRQAQALRQLTPASLVGRLQIIDEFQNLGLRQATAGGRTFTVLTDAGFPQSPSGRAIVYRTLEPLLPYLTVASDARDGPAAVDAVLPLVGQTLCIRGAARPCLERRDLIEQALGIRPAMTTRIDVPLSRPAPANPLLALKNDFLAAQAKNPGLTQAQYVSAITSAARGGNMGLLDDALGGLAGIGSAVGGALGDIAGAAGGAIGGIINQLPALIPQIVPALVNPGGSTVGAASPVFSALPNATPVSFPDLGQYQTQSNFPIGGAAGAPQVDQASIAAAAPAIIAALRQGAVTVTQLVRQYGPELVAGILGVGVSEVIDYTQQESAFGGGGGGMNPRYRRGNIATSPALFRQGFRGAYPAARVFADLPNGAVGVWRYMGQCSRGSQEVSVARRVARENGLVVRRARSGGR